MRALMLAICAVVMAMSGCRLEHASDNTGVECSDAQECDDPDDALGCVSTNEDNPNVGAGNPTGVCMPPPDGWTCRGDFWNDDEELCDCGCGIVDADCNGNATSAACDENNCPDRQVPVATNNANCV